MTYREIAEKAGIAYPTLVSRIDKGMTVEEAVNTPIVRRSHTVRVHGEILTIAEASRKYRISQATIGARLRLGWFDERAVFNPLKRRLSRRNTTNVSGKFSTKIRTSVVLTTVSLRTVQRRLKKGWSVHDAWNAPIYTRKRKRNSHI